MKVEVQCPRSMSERSLPSCSRTCGRDRVYPEVAAPKQTTALGVVMLLQAVLPIGTLWASRGVVNAPSGRSAGLGRQLMVARPCRLPPGSPWPSPPSWSPATARAVAQAAQEVVSDRLQAHVNGELIAAVNRFRGLARFRNPGFANHLATAQEPAVSGAFNLLYYGGHLVGQLRHGGDGRNPLAAPATRAVAGDLGLAAAGPAPVWRRRLVQFVLLTQPSRRDGLDGTGEGGTECLATAIRAVGA